MKSRQPMNGDDSLFKGIAQTAGIILGAGSSKRLGYPKQLLNWQGIPFILQVAQNALEAGLKPLIVVTGAYYESIEKVLEHLPVCFAHNPEWASGISSSLKAGLNYLPQQCDSAMFLLSDLPQISPILMRLLIERFTRNRAPITAPKLGNTRGNPVLFSKSTCASLLHVEGDQGGRGVFDKFEIDWLPWIDDRVLLDVDKAEEFINLKNAFFPISVDS